MSILLPILTFLLVLVSLFMVLVILAQRTKSDGGVGAGLGGGMAEAAFGAESGNVLTKSTQVCAVTFFVLAFALFLGHIHEDAKNKRKADSSSVAPSGSDFVKTPDASATTPGPEGATPTVNAPAPAAPQPEAPQPVAPTPTAPAPTTP